MKRKRIKLLGISLSVIAILLLSVNPALEYAIHHYLQNKMRILQDSSAYVVSYKKLNLNIFNTEAQFTDLKFLSVSGEDPTSSKKGLGLLREIDIERARIKGVDIGHFLWKESLEISRIDFDSVNLTVLKPVASVEFNNEESVKPVMDSLKLPGIKRIKLGDIGVSNLTLNILSAQLGDTISSYRSKDIHIEGVGLSRHGEGEGNSFIPELDEMVFRLGEQQYLLENGLYSMAYKGLLYVHKDESLLIDKLQIAPHISVDSFATRNSGKNYDRLSMGLHALRVEGLGLHRIISTGAVQLQKIELDSLEIDIFKDRSHPLDPNLDIPLPSRTLEDLGLNLSIDTVLFNGHQLSFYEKQPNSSRHLETYLTGLRGEIRNIKSGGSARHSEVPLELKLQGDLLGAIKLELDIKFPYGKDALYINGRTSGSSNLASLNPTMIPAMNMRFGDGKLDGLTFQANGNSQNMEGELTMLFSDLEVELLKPDHHEDLTLSWLANAVVKDSNPNKRGRTLRATIYAERDPNKELMKYIIKAIKSGVVNTLNPLGKNRRDR
ncbi:hypothetical protein [Winogradskyella aurantia]|uniref:AsmA-like C-terminal domain-containing protein n=1 Tax=Winogradskyella aurantia TaxID=1915063 RepID=A0A265URQ0_9FLAO|nr:hypothetical protein [Winogradskyella aurantia]OZV67989.1 hypothetical protein CA834_10070 [Winogradskyella aurantia]